MSVVATDADVISTGKELATRPPVGRNKAIGLISPFGADKMNTKMKGLLKGLRYISQIFEAKEEEGEEDEHEMVIGFPTDVKHVAHIGCDGPSSGTTPSWMNEFKNTFGPLSPTATTKELDGNKPGCQDLQSLMEAETDPGRGPSRAPRHTRRPSGGGSQDSPPHDSADPQKPHRRRHSSNTTSSSSANNEASEGSARPRRRAIQDSDSSSSRDGVPRQSRHQRKSKGSSGGSGGTGSTSRPSRSKGPMASTENEPTIESEENHANEPSIGSEENHGKAPHITPEENHQEGNAVFIEI